MRGRVLHSRGFTLPEALMATLVFGVIAGTAMQVMTGVKGRVDRGEAEIGLEQQGRQATELIMDDVRRAGLRIFTNEGSDSAATRQHVIVEASPSRLAFYADTNREWYSPMDAVGGAAVRTWKYGDGVSGYRLRPFPNVYALTFPPIPGVNGDLATTVADAQGYFAHVAAIRAAGAEVPEYALRSAEVVLYTLDTNQDGDGEGDGKLDAMDKAAHEAGGTRNPSDAVLRRHIFYTRLDGDAPTHESISSTVARGVRVQLDENDLYPNGRLMPPLFVYHIAEHYHGFDFDGDGSFAGQLIFGDCVDLRSSKCGNGVLDPEEIENLLSLNERNQTDIADNYFADARFLSRPGSARWPAAGDLIERIRGANSTMASDEDARQLIRNSIGRVQINLIVEQGDVSPGMVHPSWSAPGKPYRYAQHDLTAVAYLPNAFFLSKNQLLASPLLRYETSSDGSVSGISLKDRAYDPNDPAPCEAGGARYPCWPTGPGGGGAREDRSGNPRPTSTPGAEPPPTATPAPPPATSCDGNGGQPGCGCRICTKSNGTCGSGFNSSGQCTGSGS
jgi:type II secretory pathway pseudopilin PulG